MSSIFKIPKIKIAFSDKRKDILCKNDLDIFCTDVGLDCRDLITINQVHSSNVVSANLPGNYDCYDGIINFGGRLVCSIKVADCLPIYFVNSISKTIGLVHAGWRGLSLGIIKNYLKKICEENDGYSNTFVLIGPSIQNCCFQIQRDVLDHFDSRFYSKIDDKHFQVDLQKWALSQILNSEIKNNNIYVSKDCTFCNKHKYHSFRRDYESSERMYAIIGWEK